MTDQEFNDRVQELRRSSFTDRLNQLEERMRRDHSESRDEYLALFLSIRRDMEADYYG